MSDASPRPGARTGVVSRGRARLAWVAAAALGSACGDAGRPGLEPQNLVLVTVQDLRPERLSAAGWPRPTTWLPSDPTQRAQDRAFDLDWLTRSGVLFPNALAPTEHTIPALVTLFTGRSPLASGVLQYSDVLPSDVPTLTELLAARGFECAGFATHGPLELGASLARGFDPWFQCADDDETLARARAWADERDFGNGRPFFLWVHLAGTAPPFERGEGDVSFLREGYDGPALDPQAFLRAVKRGELEPTPSDWDHLDALHDEALAELTRGLAHFLAGVFDFHLARAETSETWARTAFVLTAPSGTDLLRGQARLGHARALAPEELGVPIVLRHPDSLTGERVFDDVVGLVDVLPTVCEWLDVEPPGGPAEPEGRSLFGVTDAARGRSFEARPAFATLVGRMHAVRTPRWHMIHDPERVRAQGLPGAVPAEADAVLFDCRLDPYGRRDVAAAHPDEVARLAALIADWVEREGRP